jgi:hypothetical protein
MRVLFKIEVIVGSLVILMSLLIAVFITKKKALPVYLQKFYLYPLLAFILSIFTITNNFIYKFSKTEISIAESIYVILEPLFWGHFFVLLFNNKRTKKLVIKISTIIILLIFSLVIVSNLKRFNHQVMAISNLSFCFYCSIYFANLFKDKPVKKLSIEPSFWIVSGIFFYAAISLPLFPFSDYFRGANSPEFYLPIISIVNLVIIIMHLFFIKGYLCLIKQTKV